MAGDNKALQGVTLKMAGTGTDPSLTFGQVKAGSYAE